MAQSIREVMTADPVTVPPTATVADAAKAMRDRDMGDVLVAEGGRISGIVTDRDIVVRAVADGRDPSSTPVTEVCSTDPITLSPTDSVGDAVRIMRDKAVRRVPVVEDGRPVGIVAIGDLAVAYDQDSALADISANSPNN